MMLTFSQNKWPLNANLPTFQMQKNIIKLSGTYVEITKYPSFEVKLLFWRKKYDYKSKIQVYSN